MLRSAIRTLREPRYAALGVLMVVVAIVCVAAGTWQIARFEGKHHANDDLRANAHRAGVPVEQLLPADGRRPDDSAVEFRQVTARGTYEVAQQRLVAGRTIGDTIGFLVVTPFRTSTATLLVVRGFVPALTSGKRPVIAAPPGGTVRITARAHPPESGSALDPSRYPGPVFEGYVELEGKQPGGAGLTALPKPDLSNPAGGALEPQHFAYVVQWYLFAVLALAAPFAMARSEAKQREREREFDDAPASPVEALTPEDIRSAKLADRYGR